MNQMEKCELLEINQIICFCIPDVWKYTRLELDSNLNKINIFTENSKNTNKLKDICDTL